MNRQDFIDQIKRHEGYNGKIYRDTVGVLTCGWGHALHVGTKVPMAASEAFLISDLNSVEIDFPKLHLNLDPQDMVREYVIKNMLFNLGLMRLMTFKNFLAAVRTKQWENAALHMLQSRWADQVGERAIELADMMRTGAYRRQS